MKNKNFISLFGLFLIIGSVFSQFQQQWVQRVPYPAFFYETNPAIRPDRAGNIYTLSVDDSTIGGNTRHIIKLWKYLPGGTQSWCKVYYNPSNTHQYPIDLLVTNTAEIFILAVAVTPSGDDYLVLKYNSAGVFQWANQYDSPGDDKPTGFAVDNNGNVYVTGTSGLFPNTIKINSSGTLVWHKSITGSFMNYSTGKIVCDYSNNIYIQYEYMDTETLTLRFVKYNVNGDTLFDRISSYYTMENLNPWDLQRDSTGYIYFGSDCSGVYPYTNFTAINVKKYDTNGNLLTTSEYSGGAMLTPGHFRIMNDGSIVMTGYVIESTSSPSKLLLCKFNSSGTLIRTIKTNYVSSLSCYGESIALDKYSNVYVCGTAFTTGTIENIITIKYTQECDSLYCILYNGQHGDDYATNLAVDTNNNVCVIGMSRNADNSMSVVTIKYSQPIGIKKISSNIPDKFSLSQNYPNPFNPTTVINYKLPITDYIKLAVYDILGREVAVLVNEKQQAGEYEVTWDGTNFSSGIYFYKIVARQSEPGTGDYTETKRMVLVK